MKYKVGDEFLWIHPKKDQIYKILDISDTEYLVKLVFSNSEDDILDVGIYEDWHDKPYIDDGSVKLTKLDKLLYS